MYDEGHVQDGFTHEQTMGVARDFPRIVVRIDSLEKMLQKAHESLVELEARISPVLTQESPAVLKDATPGKISDSAATVSQRLFSLELRTAELIDQITALYNRSEV
jgi:hypothetical protein